MVMLRKILLLAFTSLLSFQSYAQVSTPAMTTEELHKLENHSAKNIYYHVGAVYGYGEMINYELKKIGLSGPITSKEMDTYEHIFADMIERQGVKYYREEDFLVTDLFAHDIAATKSLLVIYKHDADLEAYFQLKKDKRALEATGKLDLPARREIARRFGELLSYGPDKIEENLKRSGFH